MPVRISDVRNFIEVATSSTMREAADRIGITQPALSESIKRLEVDLSETLFYRSRTGVALTPGGQVALQKANSVISSLETFEARSDDSSQRLLTIGCHPLVASYYLPSVLKLIQKENPRYRIRLKHELSRSIQLEIQQGKIDVGVVVNAISSPDLIIKHVANDEFGVWRSSNKSAVEDKIFCNLALTQTQLILRKWKQRPTNLIDTDNIELIVRFVNEGLGYGILPARAVTLLNAEHCKKLADAPTYHDKISIIFRPEFGKHSAERLLLDNLRRSIK